MLSISSVFSTVVVFAVGGEAFFIFSIFDNLCFEVFNILTEDLIFLLPFKL
jgi:hypothetical protein